MARTLRDRIYKKVLSLPVELRSVAEQDLSLLSARSRLSPRDLARIVADPAAEPQLRSIAAWVIGFVGEASLAPALEQVARSPLPEGLLWEISKALCNLNQGRLLFRDLLKSESPEVRRIAVYALGRLGERGAERDLCRLLLSSDEAPALRGQAAESLGYLALETSLPCLLKAAKDMAPEVRFWTAFALGRIGSRRAEAVLVKMASSDHVQVDGWGEVSSEAAQALQAIREKKESL